MPTRFSSASLRCPHPAQSPARVLASASTASWTGVGHGPFDDDPPCRHRYQVARGIPNSSQNLVTVTPAATRSSSSCAKPGRAPPPFRHRRSSMWASPNAEVNSATWASSCCSRLDGVALAPAATARRPPSTNWSRQFAIEVCDTPSRRAASAIETSPRSTATTIRTFSSGVFVGGLPIPSPSHQHQLCPVSRILTRGTPHLAPPAHRPTRGRLPARTRRAAVHRPPPKEDPSGATPSDPASRTQPSMLRSNTRCASTTSATATSRC